MRHNQIFIARCANGFMVQMPGIVPDRRGYAAPSAADMFKEMMPAIKGMIRQIHADPVLEEIRQLQEQEAPGPESPEQDEVMGREVDSYVFPNWEQVVVFLGELQLV